LGTHWNDWGAYVAYRELMRAAAEWFPELETLAADRYRRLWQPGGEDILLSMLGLDGRGFPETLAFEPRFEIRAVEEKSDQPLDEFEPALRAPLTSRHPAASGPSVLVVRDSFAHRLIPFLSETFARVHYEWPASLTVPKRFRGMIQRERPALVIQEFAENALEKSPWRFRAFGKLEDAP
jgi:hypothetical protein